MVKAELSVIDTLCDIEAPCVECVRLSEALYRIVWATGANVKPEPATE